jgi:predicted aspartyl protease
MPRVVYDPSTASIVIDLLLESADGRSSLVIPVVLDTGASLTIVAVDIMAQLGLTRAIPALGASVLSQAAALNMLLVQLCVLRQKVANLEALCHDLPPESGVDGLLGMNFLKHFKLTIRFRRGIVELNKER